MTGDPVFQAAVDLAEMVARHNARPLVERLAPYTLERYARTAAHLLADPDEFPGAHTPEERTECAWQVIVELADPSTIEWRTDQPVELDDPHREFLATTQPTGGIPDGVPAANINLQIAERMERREKRQRRERRAKRKGR